MEGETISIKNSFESIKSVDTISILVVDDDTTCLTIVAAMLKKFQYEVVTVKHPRDALCTLRIKGGVFDLVVSDVHMPDMNGFELQQAIAQEFHLPVVLMSADENEGVVLKGMENGAAYFVLKPVSPDDLKDLWQFASMKKKSQVVIEETGSTFPEEKTSSGEIVVSVSSVDEEDMHVVNKGSKRKSPKDRGSGEKGEANSVSSSQKRPKIIWTNSLHNRFLEAIRSIGLDNRIQHVPLTCPLRTHHCELNGLVRGHVLNFFQKLTEKLNVSKECESCYRGAVPKKILEVMNVPGLTRENVASHLQKYRIFLRRVSDASYKVHYSADKGLSSRSFRSSITSSSRTSPSILMLNRFDKLHDQNPGDFPRANGVSSFSSHKALEFGQPRLLSNRGNLLKSTSKNPNMSVNLDASILGSTGINLDDGHEVSSNKDIGITSNLISPMPSKDFTFQSNYVGYKLSNIQQELKSSNYTMNVPTDHELIKNDSVSVADMSNDNTTINLDQILAWEFETPSSSSSMTNINAGGNYQMLMPSNMASIGDINEFDFNQILDLPACNVVSNQEPLVEDGLNSTFADYGQQNVGESITSSNLYSGTNHWDNHASSLDQALNQGQGHEDLINTLKFGTSSQPNKTLKSPIEYEDDDFLQSLLDSYPFGEDQTLEGI